LNREFTQTVWNESIERDLDRLLRLAIAEDAGEAGDLTTTALVPDDVVGQATVAVRSAGVIAGLPAGEIVLNAVDPRLVWHQKVADGQPVQSGDPVATIQGPARSLLQAERLVLNLLGRLSGIATLTRKYVEAVAGTRARIYDTRKTTPGWRRLEKYAVRCGGGNNHRTGLYDAVLIKDNHLALGSRWTNQRQTRFTPAEAVRQARRFIEKHAAAENSTIVEIEVDTLEQLEEVLPAGPDIVLLDNMTPDQLREAVAIRDQADRAIELEASGGVTLDSVANIAASGVDRISVGALTHSAVSLDLGLDWIA
jgi:nicotinate-nucleotide pyrophosphorylase (carboxylating)